MAIISRGLFGGAAALTAVVLLAGCGGVDPRLGPVSQRQLPSTPSPTPSPTPTALTVDQYTAALASIDQPVTDALAKVAAGGTPDQLTAAAGVLIEAQQKLGALAAPAAAFEDNLTLSRTLSTLSQDLTTLASGNGSNTCAAANPAVQIGALDSIGTLTTTVQQLTTDGYPSGLTVPVFPKQQSRSLANGTYLRDTDRSGKGRLTIKNGGSSDAVVSLNRGSARAFSIYLRKSGSITVTGVRDGSYTVYFSTGSDWDAKGKGFTSGCAYQKFDKQLNYTTSYHSTYIEYTTYTLSLYGVAGGTASTSSVPPGEFPAP